MDSEIIAIYCLCDDFLKSVQHHDDPQVTMSDAEVMTVALVAAFHFSGNYAKARELLAEHGYIPHMLSRSRLSRRLHRVKPWLLMLFGSLSEWAKVQTQEDVYLVDTMPIGACDNIRIPRAKLYQEEQYRGYQASKRRSFYGLKLHLMVTHDAIPVAFFLTPGSTSDTQGLQWFDFDLPSESWIIADKAYNDYELEDILKAANLHLLPMRKSNSKRPFPPYIRYLQASLWTAPVI